MNWFPQLGAGTVAQYPIRRVRSWRNIENQLEGGGRIAIPDVGARRIDWKMSWRDLNESEAASLREHFAASSGSYGAFSFVDPMANLLGWTEDLARPDWQSGQLTCVPGADDPFGTQHAWTISNSAAGEQSLSQSVGIPGSYVACFSLWLRSDTTAAVALERDGVGLRIDVGPIWRRASFSTPGRGAAATFGLSLNAGDSVQAFGFQVEAQPYPSQYKTMRTARGIYPETRFADDDLTLVATAPGCTSCEIALVSRV